MSEWTFEGLTRLQVEAIIAEYPKIKMEVEEGGDLAVSAGDFSYYWWEDDEPLTEEKLREGIKAAQEEEAKWRNFKWGKGVICNALHHVGDDPVKGQIENMLFDAFRGQPEVLNTIARIFASATAD